MTYIIWPEREGFFKGLRITYIAQASGENYIFNSQRIGKLLRIEYMKRPQGMPLYIAFLEP